MKKIHTIVFIFLATLFSSCEEVVEVDLDTAAPRLVIDASLRWIKGTAGNEQVVRLSTTTAYFSDTIPPVFGATVSVSDQSNNTFQFIEVPQTGQYICNDFIPVLNATYTLTVVYQGQTFAANEILKPVPSFDFVQQNNEGGFTGEDIEIKAFFTDDGATDDFYLFGFLPTYAAIPRYDLAEDKFFQGNQIFSIFSSEGLSSEDNVLISIAGISERYYNYMNILIAIAGSNGGSPFQSPPATVRGNIVNTSDDNNYALGYFNLSEVALENYEVQ